MAAGTKMKLARKIGRTLGYILFLFIAVIVLAELALQAAALFASSREEKGSASAKRVVLAVGDSHTYGLMVPAEAAYPSRLQALLDERAPNQYHVVNLGIPAMNTGQVLDRLRLGLKQYRPQIVIVWCGVNNVWNRAESTDTAEDGWASRVVGFAERYSRVYRFFRVWRHDRELESALKQAPPEQARYEFELRRGVDAAHSKAKIATAGKSEEIEFFHSGYRVDTDGIPKTMSATFSKCCTLRR
jgi:hypothetical protein